MRTIGFSKYWSHRPSIVRSQENRSVFGVWLNSSDPQYKLHLFTTFVNHQPWLSARWRIWTTQLVILGRNLNKVWKANFIHKLLCHNDVLYNIWYCLTSRYVFLLNCSISNKIVINPTFKTLNDNCSAPFASWTFFGCQSYLVISYAI